MTSRILIKTLQDLKLDLIEQINDYFVGEGNLRKILQLGITLHDRVSPEEKDLYIVTKRLDYLANQYAKGMKNELTKPILDELFVSIITILER